jgi:hypothetical protein
MKPEPRLAMSGPKWWQPQMTPIRLTSTWYCHSSTGILPSSPTTARPALFTSTSVPPQSSVAFLAMASTCSGLRTSTCMAWASLPRRRSVSAVSSAVASLTSVTSTRAPRPARS